MGVADALKSGRSIDHAALREVLDDEGLRTLTTGATNSLKKLTGRINYVAERVAV